MSAKIRMHFNEDEWLHPDIKPFVRAFLYKGVGVLIRPIIYLEGSTSDICFELISEDDEYWTCGGSTLYYSQIEDYVIALNAAKEWCEKKTLNVTNVRSVTAYQFKTGTQCCKQKFNKWGSWQPIINN